MDGLASSAGGNDAAAPPVGQATLVRGRHRWTFACGLGDGPAFREALASLAARPDCPLDRFDAALVGMQLAGELAGGFNKLLGGAAPR